jgi:hypothetical protein
MIRRESSLLSDHPGTWILLPQIEHARLSGMLAEHWGAGGFAPFVPRQELLWAIYHHDDGWHDWDANPGVDPQHGWPRSFLEMELSDSLSIWESSIRRAAERGPLQAFAIAGHFTALLARSSVWTEHDPGRAAAEYFMSTYKSLMAEWLGNWQAQNEMENTSHRARQAVAMVQWFDALSLWFCCNSEAPTTRFQPPGGPTLTATRLDARDVTLEPWPLEVESLNLEVGGYSLPVAHYQGRVNLALLPSQPVSLHWRLKRSGA